MRTLKNQELADLVRGSTILGTGGGGDPVKAMKEVKELSKVLSLISLENMADSAYVCTAFMIGSSGTYERDSSKALVTAKNALEKITKKKFAGVIPVEIGAGAVAEAIKTANMLDIPAVDADVVGKRSAPEVYLETLTLAGIPREPLAVANNKGDVKIIKSSKNYKETEKVLRNFAIKSGGCAYVIGYPMKVSDIRGVVGEETLSLSMKIGKCLGNPDPIKEVCRITGGSILFKGVITNVKKENKDGFLIGKVFIGNGKSQARVWFKNENIMLWINEKLKACAPDLICILNSKNGYGRYNRDLEKGEEVNIIGIPALPIWKTRMGLELFGPKAFGFEEEYVDFEVVA